MPVSPFAPAQIAELPPIRGVRLAAAQCGIRYRDRRDLMVAVLDSPSAIAGVFTRSTMPGAPVEWCRACLPAGEARAIVVNSGNANVFTGRAGREACEATAEAAAAALGCERHMIFLSSTGVIGEKLSADRIVAALPVAIQNGQPDGWREAAEAIMTTDTFPKLATASAEIGGRPVTINGFAKGSGMIAPDMATMLGFVFTDAAIAAPVLQALLRPAVERSFNAITVDGDTSTSDTVLLVATAAAGNALAETAQAPSLRSFRRALERVLVDLAQQVVKDGEGAEKFVTIDVTGAASSRAARRVGMAIANSPLVKTALAAGDANWGRIVAAVGKSGERAERDKLSIAVGGVAIAEQGGPVPGYDEAPVSAHMKGRDIAIAVDLGVGKGRARVWTCDLTHRYIDINGSYRS
jgi:glutamate N-acetyltransferase / amino-acid N-acetyltransferase